MLDDGREGRVTDELQHALVVLAIAIIAYLDRRRLSELERELRSARRRLAHDHERRHADLPPPANGNGENTTDANGPVRP
jgi:hypothetical protein